MTRETHLSSVMVLAEYQIANALIGPSSVPMSPYAELLGIEFLYADAVQTVVSGSGTYVP